MQLLGLPNETLEHDAVFGDILVSVDQHPEFNPIVTIVWGTPFNLPAKNKLYTCLSIEYDINIMPVRTRNRWLFELLAQPRPYTNYNIRGETDDLLVVQALAYDQMSQIRKRQSYDKTSSTGSYGPANAGYGEASEAIHRSA